MLKRTLAAFAAILMSGGVAFAVITGTWSEKQDEQAALGQLQLGQGTCNTTATNTPSCVGGSGVIQTNSLTTAQNAATAITMSNTRVAVGDQVQCTVDPQSSAGTPFCANAAVTAGQVVFNVGNISASALNNTVKIYFWVNKAGNAN